jgi:hypothetical protein
MQNFRAPSAELITPDGWLDRSTYVVSGTEIGGFTPNVVVTFSPGVMDPYLRRHVKIQVDEMQKKLPDFQLVAQSDPFPGPFGEMVSVEYEWNSAEAGTRLHQYQLYSMAGQTLYTVTATGTAMHWRGMQSVMLQIVMSFRPAVWTAEPPAIPPG